MMSTHCHTTIWLEGRTEVRVPVTEGSAWAWVGNSVTIHTAEGATGLEDLEVIEQFFRDGLDAVDAARSDWMQQHLPGLEPVQ